MTQVKEQEKKYSDEDLKNEIEKVKGNLMLPKNLSDKVYNTLSLYNQENRMSFPANYNLGNALTNAYLIIQQDPKLSVCSQESIVQSMINMATLGLNPRKQQCYYIPMGNKCTLIVSYFGKQTALKRIRGIKDIRSDIIYEGTEYELIVDEYGNDDIRIIKPCPLKERKNDKIEGAWARIIMDENVWGTSSYVCIMTVDDIKNSHKMGSSKGNSMAHKDFFNEMAKKSVINRCIKNFINTTGDENLIIESLNDVVENDYREEETQAKYYEKKTINIDDVIDNEEAKEINDKQNEKEVVVAEIVEEKKQDEKEIVKETVKENEKKEKPKNVIKSVQFDDDEFSIGF